ncbi:ATP-binding protein [Ramlibacter sp. AN1015]|uniref:ATP-binding protein n=1 Tax=Ramlibacter sp. AN1015 TaxID=3133428 RepID=UPI0030BC0B5E
MPLDRSGSLDQVERQSFLLTLTDVLRGAQGTPQILQRVCELLGQQFQVQRVGYGHVDESLDRIEYEICWTDGTVPTLLGVHPASAFGQKVIDRLRGGHTVVIGNVREHVLTSDAAALRTSHEVDTRAILVVPLFTAGQLRTIVYLNQRAERSWSMHEVDLMEEVAERTRELIERTRAEAALRESESRWRGLFERMGEGFFVGEAIRDEHGSMVDFRFLELNPAFERLTGVPTAGALGKPVTQVIPGVPPELIATYARVVDTGESAEFEVLIPALNDRWYEARARRIGTDQFSVLFLEITERKTAQLALKQSEQRYRTLFETIDEGFCVMQVLFDAQDRPVDYRFLEVNPAFERQSGLADAQGRSVREMIPNIELSWIETYGQIALTGEPARFASYAASMGRWFDVFAFRIGPAEERKVALLFTDISERKRAEDALRESDVRKDEFLATLAHELRNPLAPIRSGLDILRRRLAANDPSARTVNLMDRQLGHLVRIVDDLLDISRISRGKLHLRKETLTLQDVIALAVESTRPAVDAAHHALHVDVPQAPIELEADGTRLSQVLSNVLHNAAKYTPPHGTIRLIASAPRDGRVVVQVIDSGHGIPAGQLESIFELFTQLESSGSNPQAGLGIGLALARRLMDLHGGTIRADSAGEGCGSTFTLELPALAPAAAQRPQAAQPSGAASARTVLVVDDNVDAAQTLAWMLELDGHNVRVAHTGEQAVAVVASEAPDLVFLDLGLPDISGLEVARRLREAGSAARLVALTGWGAAGDLQRTRDAGFDLHLTKPVAADSIARALNMEFGGS